MNTHDPDLGGLDRVCNDMVLTSSGRKHVLDEIQHCTTVYSSYMKGGAIRGSRRGMEEGGNKRELMKSSDVEFGSWSR